MAGESHRLRRVHSGVMAPARESHAPDGLRIAVIDANAQVRSALERRLGEDPRVADVLALDHSPETLTSIRNHDPHVVLIDPRAPETDPDDFVLPVALQKPAGVPSYVVVVHVTYHSVAEELAAKMAGADLYCLKGLKTPVLIDLLMATVCRCLPPERWPAALQSDMAASSRRDP